MAIDPRMLEEALRMNDGQVPREQTGGVMEMLTPKFNEVQFAEAGQLHLSHHFKLKDFAVVQTITVFVIVLSFNIYTPLSSHIS